MLSIVKVKKKRTLILYCATTDASLVQLNLMILMSCIKFQAEKFYINILNYREKVKKSSTFMFSDVQISKNDELKKI